MAQYIASARSNYFVVRDEADFRAWAEKRGLEVLEGGTIGDSPAFGITPGRNSDDGAWPTHDFSEDDENGDPVEINIAQELSTHLADGQVAILMEVGAEKLRYLVGWAVAVNSNGDKVETSLDAIYDLAQKLGDGKSKITNVAY